MRYQLIKQIQRLFTMIGLISFISIVLLATQGADFSIASFISALPSDLVPTNWGLQWGSRPQIALISGHAGSDSGAICTDASGQTILTEAEVTAAISAQAADRLQRQGYAVLVLDEFDTRLTNLQAAVLLSLHIDSCVDLSGYKAAHSLNSRIPQTDQLLTDCIAQYYARQTGLREHPETITHNMTEYHAFGRIDPTTPAAILEMGFLGGDQLLLTTQQEQVVQGIVDSLDCFLNAESVQNKTK